MAQSEDNCTKILISSSNNPFACISKSTQTVTLKTGKKVAIKDLNTGGSTSSGLVVSVISGNAEPAPVYYFDSSVYGYDGKLVRVFNYASQKNDNTYPENFVIDDACKVVCKWQLIQTECETGLCPPFLETDCTNPSFMASNIKIASH